MPDERTPETWDERYQTGDLPWDTGVVEGALVEVLAGGDLGKPRNAVDIGCGTGTNVVYLAQRGIAVTGSDVSPKAIELATAKVSAADLTNVRLVVGDVLAEAPVAAGSADFVFDRGCLHCMTEAERPRFAERVSEMLAAGGHWLTLCGNADEPRPEGVPGPPQLTAAQIVSAVEPLFELRQLRAFHFGDIGDGYRPLGWSCLLRRR